MVWQYLIQIKSISSAVSPSGHYCSHGWFPAPIHLENLQRCALAGPSIVTVGCRAAIHDKLGVFTHPALLNSPRGHRHRATVELSLSREGLPHLSKPSARLVSCECFAEIVGTGLGMEQSCFQAKGSTPPACGVHNVLLVLDTLPIDAHNPHLGQITCYLCPVSRKVVADVATQS
jgi:hypothetical protein